MSDSISRQAAIDVLYTCRDTVTIETTNGGTYIDMEQAEEMIEQLPSAQPKRTGRWIPHPEIGGGETWLCSECGEKTTSTVMGKPRYKWCPMCGCKMEVEHDTD